MQSGKGNQLWFVNILSFVLLCVLAFTGLINWLVLPRGYAATGGFLVGLRHFFTGVHEFAAVLFLVVMAVHILLHLGYIKSRLKR